MLKTSIPLKRCNASLALSVFDESTINALYHFSNEYPEFSMATNVGGILLMLNRVTFESETEM